jgi:tRNA A37 threonylcarbamoyladenosine modification protein TsaB
LSEFEKENNYEEQIRPLKQQLTEQAANGAKLAEELKETKKEVVMINDKKAEELKTKKGVDKKADNEAKLAGKLSESEKKLN